jgi:hypothetical protein
VAGQNDKLVLCGTEIAQVQGLPAFKSENNVYHELDDAQQSRRPCRLVLIGLPFIATIGALILFG